MALTDRDMRKLANTKQSSIEFQGKPSIHGMLDGQVAIEKQSNSQLALYRKKYGKLWKSYMSSNGDQYVDKTLSANTLKYTNKFIDYRSFSHNFYDDLDANEHFLPWGNVNELTSLRPDVGYLVPFNMTCHKLIFKVPDLDDNTDNILFTIKKIDDGDDTIDSVCTYTYSTTFVDNTSITINRSDWSATPSVETGDVVAISITASHADIVTSAKNFFITSVWRVEVVI
tara:strand:+ start:228 stop:911 length:684 start_codon:yes stop_codon:yes gene_type:complete